MTSRRPISTQEGKDSQNEDTYDESPCKGDDEHLYVPAPIDKLGVPGRWLRHKLLDSILVGAPVLTSIQRFRSPSRTYFMKMISFLGTEDFYTVLFMLLSWTLDSRLGRLFGILMGIGFYAAGFLKSILCLPRPEWPQIKPLEAAYDWALPSHHSMLGTMLPWYLWTYISVHKELSSAQLACLFVIIALWSFCVMFSRLYLGVHSPADIVSGGFVGVLILSLWLQFDDAVDSFISQQRIENFLQCVLLLLVLLVLHPKSDPGNPSFTDNCCLSGVVIGIIAAQNQRSRLIGFPSLLETLSSDATVLTFLHQSTVRLVVGAVVIFGVREILKFFVLTSIVIFYRLVGLEFYSSSKYKKANLTFFKHYTKEFRLPPICNKKASDAEDDGKIPSVISNISQIGRKCGDYYTENAASSQILTNSSSMTNVAYNPSCWDVDVPSKCIIYSVLTYAALEVVPLMFAFMGI